MLPYLRELGWKATVAVMRPEQNPNQKDEMLLRTVPAETEVRHLGAWDETWCRKLGFGHVSNRIFWPWRGAVLQLLREKKYDLVFLSTTSFTVMAHGAYWLRKTGVPYVIDLHDPIHVPGGSYQRHNAPGGYWKYRLANLLNGWIEKKAFSRVAGVVATSRHYLGTLRERYPNLRHAPMKAIPFGVPFRDLDILKGLTFRNRLFAKKKEEKIIFYAGRGGPDLHPALHALFSTVADCQKRDPKYSKKIKFYFAGTNYSPQKVHGKQVVEIAKTYGVEKLVTEKPERISYFLALRGLMDADGALILGSTKPDYTASKTMLCLSVAKNVLGILHQKSIPYRLLQNHKNAAIAGFRESPEEKACHLALQNALQKIIKRTSNKDKEIKNECKTTLSAKRMTQEIVRLWMRSISPQNPKARKGAEDK